MHYSVRRYPHLLCYTHTHARLMALFQDYLGKPVPRSRQITTPALHHSVFYRPDIRPSCRPTNSVKALKALHLFCYNVIMWERVCCQGGMGDTEYLAAFQQIVMPVAYEVCVHLSCLPVIAYLCPQCGSYCIGLFQNQNHLFGMAAMHAGFTQLHTHPFNGLFSGTTQLSRYQKGKTNPDFTEARDSEWQWHQLGHMQVCTSLQTDNYASTPPLSFLQARYPPFLPPNQQCQSTEGTTSLLL